MTNILKYKKTILIFKNILLVFLSAFFSDLFNLCYFMPFVPIEQKFTVSLSIYLIIFEIIWNMIYDYIENKCAIKIEINLNIKNEFEKLSKYINCGFNSYDLAEIYGQIKINATPKQLKKIKLLLVFPPWVCVQNECICDEVLRIENPNNCSVNFDKMLNEKSTLSINSVYEFKLPLIKNVHANTCREDDIECRIESHNMHVSKLFVNFKNNTIHLKSN